MRSCDDLGILTLRSCDDLGILNVRSCDDLGILTVRSCDDLGILTVRSCDDLGILTFRSFSHFWDVILCLYPWQSLLLIGSSDFETRSSVFLRDNLFFWLGRSVFRVPLSFRFQTTTVPFWLLLKLTGGVNLLCTMLFVEHVRCICSTSDVTMIS